MTALLAGLPALSWMIPAPAPVPGPRVAYAPGVWLVPRWQADVSRRELPHRDWHERAACRDYPGADAVFFGVDEVNRPTLSPTAIEHARALCRSCPVTAQCLEWAMTARHHHSNGFVSVGEEFGIWAGTTGRQRALMHKRARRAVS